MKIATLQLNSHIRQRSQNIAQANDILASKPLPGGLDLLVLPELAFTGYNFPSLESIKPFLEPTTSGPTTQWAIATAKRLGCHVIVGYPEVSTDVETSSSDSKGEREKTEVAYKNYNSTVTISPSGEILANYRKSFLYYTDESWAAEGPGGFYCDSLGTLGRVGLGICMDINPHEFTAPWDAYEFTSHMLTEDAKLVVLSMAWLTHTPLEALLLSPEKPALETISYWIERFAPFLGASKTGGDITVVFSNRVGTEVNEVKEMTAKNGQMVPLGDAANYAGSSCVMRFHGGNVSILDMLGQAEEGFLVIDTVEVCVYLSILDVWS